MDVSASQFESFLLCPRKWWLKSIARLRPMKKQSTVFGTVGHAVLERWLRADDRGVDQQTGKPVVIYPDGWMDTIEGGRRYSITPREQAALRSLVDAAITQGVIVRSPGRRIERKFDIDIGEGVHVNGSIDVDLPGEVQDHKFLKDLKWAKRAEPEHPEYLGKSVQMLTYAAAKVYEDPELGEVRVRHNSFCKNVDRPEVRITRATIDGRRIDRHVADMLDWSASMRDIANSYPTLPQWHDVPGPTAPDACSAFGGCDYADLCSGYLTPEQFVARLEQQRQCANVGAVKNPSLIDLLREEEESRKHQPKVRIPGSTTNTTDTAMSIFNKAKAISARHSGATATTATAEPVATPVAAPVAAPATASSFVTDGTPPWAVADCKACSNSDHPGFNTRGEPCRICDTKSRAAGGPTSGDFEIIVDAGVIAWVPRGANEPAPAPAAAVRTTTSVKVREVVAEDAPPAGVVDPWAGQTKAQDTAVVEEDEADVEADEAEAEDTKSSKKGEKKSAGRPKKGFRLLINCLPSSGGQKALLADVLLEQLGDLIAKDAGKASYYDLDPFRRRELFSRNIDMIADSLNRVDVVARNPAGHPEMVSLISALRARASEVIEGVA